jgi:acetate kinase
LGEIFVPLEMKSNRPCVLTVNAGSSSIKFAMFESGQSLVRTLEGRIVGVGLRQGIFTVKGPNKSDNFFQTLTIPDHATAVSLLMNWIQDRTERDSLTAVGHRVVHGGPKYWEPTRITPQVIAGLRLISPLDPEHLPEEIRLIEVFHHRFPDLPQMACFDTAFHHDMPELARLLPIPRRYSNQGIRRYGFHGLSYTYLMQELEAWQRCLMGGASTQQCRSRRFLV